MTEKEWARIRRRLKVQFEKQGITFCERCGNNNFLSFAHTKKRRFIKKDSPEATEVAVLCTAGSKVINKLVFKDHNGVEHIHKIDGCHPFWEMSGHEVMHREIRKIIDARK